MFIISGMLHAGIGEAHVNKFLTAIGINPVSNGMLKRRERDFGSCQEELVMELCEEAMEEEGRLSQKSDTDVNSVSVRASADAGWQKRGSGRSYSSLSGHASLIGDKTDKVLALETRNKQCRTCDTSERLKRKPLNHDCRKNWQGTAKAMESDMVVSMLQKQEGKTFCVDTLALDNDSTTASAIRERVKRKISDINHTKNNQGSHKFVRYGHQIFYEDVWLCSKRQQRKSRGCSKPFIVYCRSCIW